MPEKKSRQFAIKEVIGTMRIASQSDLQRELRKRGFRVTQATLSRDLQELRISRAASGNGARYLVQPSTEVSVLQPLVGVEITSLNANESVIVIRTLPGCANSVAEFIDSLNHPDIIGTIAGDNTLLVIPQSQKKTARMMQHLKKKLFEGA